MRKEYDLKKLKERKPKITQPDQLKVQLSVRLDVPVVQWLRNESEKRGIGYLSLINLLLTENMNAGSARSIVDQVRQAVREELAAVQRR